jgi:hypothetical protein
MFNTSSTTVAAFAAMLAASGLGFCAEVNGPIEDTELNSVVQEYIQCNKQQDYKCVWRLLSKKVRDGNDNDQAGYEKYVKDHGFHPSISLVEKATESDGAAMLTVSVTYVENATEKRYGGAVEEWNFVRENNTWLFDGSKTLSESP